MDYEIVNLFVWWTNRLLTNQSSSIYGGFPCMQEDGNAACGLWIKWKFILKKWASWNLNDPIWMPQVHTPLVPIHFLGLLWTALFLHGRNGLRTWYRWHKHPEKWTPQGGIISQINGQFSDEGGSDRLPASLVAGRSLLDHAPCGACCPPLSSMALSPLPEPPGSPGTRIVLVKNGQFSGSPVLHRLAPRGAR